MVETSTGAGEPIVELRSLRRTFRVRAKGHGLGRRRLVTAVADVRPRSPREVLRLHRGERRRQVDDDQDDHRHPGPDLRPRPHLWVGPRLLVLDEPTIGLDMISKERLRAFLVAGRRDRGTTLLLTTHDMGDIERLCERVLVVDQGRLAYDGSLAGLVEQTALERILVIDLVAPAAPLRFSVARQAGSELDGLRQLVAFDPRRTTAAAVLAEVTGQAEVLDLTLREPAVEDIVWTLYSRG